MAGTLSGITMTSKSYKAYKFLHILIALGLHCQPFIKLLSFGTSDLPAHTGTWFAKHTHEPLICQHTQKPLICQHTQRNLEKQCCCLFIVQGALVVQEFGCRQFFWSWFIQANEMNWNFSHSDSDIWVLLLSTTMSALQTVTAYLPAPNTIKSTLMHF